MVRPLLVSLWTMATALITGASSGIGRDLARLFAQDHHDVVLVARSREALEEVAEECRNRGAQARVLVKDLADPAAPRQIYLALAAQALHVDFLVNNAGFGTHGLFAESDLNREVQLVQVNIVALISLTRLFLPGMRQRRSGRIMNVASMAAYVAGPYMSNYYASKAYVLSHTVALARELRHTGVTATALCPGPTNTDFQNRAGIAHAKLFASNVMDCPTVARIGYAGMMRGKTIIIPGWQNRLGAFLSGFSPRTLAARVAGGLNRDR
jgi:short-subunit dehydrogenase